MPPEWGTDPGMQSLTFFNLANNTGLRGASPLRAARAWCGSAAAHVHVLLLHAMSAARKPLTRPPMRALAPGHASTAAGTIPDIWRESIPLDDSALSLLELQLAGPGALRVLRACVACTSCAACELCGCHASKLCMLCAARMTDRARGRSCGAGHALTATAGAVPARRAWHACCRA